jgi:hypothetical protein
MIRRNKESEYFKMVYKKMGQDNIDTEITFLVEMVRNVLKNREEKKVKDIMAGIKKLIKSQLEAKNKFFGLLLLVEIMKSGEDYVIQYFDKKMAKRLVIITKHRAKERGKTDLVEIGSTCLKE